MFNVVFRKITGFGMSENAVFNASESTPERVPIDTLIRSIETTWERSVLSSMVLRIL